MRILLALFLLLCASPVWALQPVYVDQMGARPDGAVRTDCSITSGQAVLTCTAGQFVPQDVGKVIAVYAAGATVNGYIKPLATTIASRQSATQVTLAAAASATANPSSRVVYGTDNTTALQRIINTTVAASNGRGSNVGGHLVFGAGTYLVSRLTFACNTVGVSWGAIPCPRTYHNIWVQGAGQFTTVLENWDPATTDGVLRIGNPDDPNYLQGFALTDLTVRQVGNGASLAGKVIRSNQLQNARFEHLTFTGSSYECFEMAGWHVIIRGNYASGCGAGGPAYAFSLSGYNITVCTDCEFVGNKFDLLLGGANYPAELGMRRGLIQGNDFTCDVTGTLTNFGVVLSNVNQGIYDVTVQQNVFRYCSLGAGGNGNGTSNRQVIKDNLFINAGVTLAGGQDINLTASTDYEDTVIHGVSTVDGNTFLVDGQATTSNAVPSFAITLGSSARAAFAQESLLVTNNRLITRQPYCNTGTKAQCVVDGTCTGGGVCVLPQGFLTVAMHAGGTRWAPSTACDAGSPTEYTRSYVFPVIQNGYYYKCTTAGTTGTTEPTWGTTVGGTTTDGDAVWTNAGRRPSLVISNNTIQGPDQFVSGYGPAENGEVTLTPGSDQDAITVSNLSGNYRWLISQQTGHFNGPVVNEYVPAGFAYGTYQRILAAAPTAGYYPINALVTNSTPSSGHRGWVATRAGRAGAAWEAGQTYAFGAAVVATVDNAHVFTQRTGAGCTSHGSTEPTWQTGAGQLTTDNTCSWKESGTAVLWLEF